MPSVVVNVSSGSTTLVAAPTVTGQFIRVEGFDLVCATANTLTFKSNTTAVWGPASFGNNGGISCNPPAGENAFVCAANEALVLTLGSGAQVGGSVRYSLGGLAS